MHILDTVANTVVCCMSVYEMRQLHADRPLFFAINAFSTLSCILSLKQDQRGLQFMRVPCSNVSD